MSKTYGQVLLDEMEQSIHFDRLSLVPDAEFDRCARAVLLEFVRRVEEKKDEILKSPGHYSAWYDEPEEQALIQAFNQLSAELKETK
jgi:hypothetical protein